MSQGDLLYDVEPIQVIATRLNREIHRADVAGDRDRHAQLIAEWRQLARHVGDSDVGRGVVDLCLAISSGLFHPTHQ